MSDVEVDEESDTLAAQLEVGEQLRLVNGQDGLDRLYLDDDLIFDEEVHSIAQFDQGGVVLNGKDLLGLEPDAEASEFVSHAEAVGPFEQPWPKTRMHFVSRCQDAVRDICVNEMNSVLSVRVRVLRGAALFKQKARLG